MGKKVTYFQGKTKAKEGIGGYYLEGTIKVGIRQSLKETIKTLKGK